MLPRLVPIAIIVVVFLGIALGLGVVAERLGDWTDAHPDKQVVVWTLWNVGVLACGAAAFMGLRRLRRPAKSHDEPL